MNMNISIECPSCDFAASKIVAHRFWFCMKVLKL